MTDSVTKKGCPKIHIDTSFLCEPVRSQEGERRNKMQKKEIDDLNDTIKWFKTARRNNDMACILPDGPMMKNIIKWLEKLREYENRQEKGEKHDKSVLMIDAPEHGCVSCLIGRNHSNCLEICIYCPIAGKSALDEEAEIIPEWCPLKPLPEKNTTENDMTDYQCGMVDGRNQCVDAIKGGNYDD